MSMDQDIDTNPIHMSDLVPYKVITPGCDEHLATLYESRIHANTEKPELTYTLHGGTFNGIVSGPQVDATRLFMQSTNVYIENTFRSGFVLGDEMGVGKTHVIALSLVQTIYEHVIAHNRIGRHVVIIPKDTLFKPLGLIVNRLATVLGITVNFLQIKDIFTKANDTFIVRQTDGVVLTTYNGYGSHVNRLVEWMEHDKTQAIFHDESHHLKSISTQSAIAASIMMDQFRHSRMMFSSGTCASTVKDLQLVGIRTGLWTKSSFPHVAKSLNGRNFFAYISNQLVRNGRYISRLLSVETAAEHIIENIDMSPESIMVYDTCAELMAKTMRIIRSKISGDEKRLHLTARLYNTSLAFFREMMLFVRLDYIIKTARHHAENNRAVVIAIQSTGESYADKEIQGIANTAMNLINAMKEKYPGDNQWDELNDEWMNLDLPHQSILDIVVDSLGGLDQVADITGRSKYWIRDEMGEWVIKTRNKNKINAERDDFQHDRKPFSIVSRTANEGINLHAMYTNSKQRVMVLAQQPWSADQEKQLEARVARTGQTSNPIVIHIVNNQLCELTVTGRHASGSRNSSSLTRGNQEISAIGSEMEDVNSMRGVYACIRLIGDLQDRVGLRTQEIRAEMGMTDSDFRLYCDETIERLRIVGALDCIRVENNKRKFGDSDDEHDASETDKNGAHSVRQFLNRILLLSVKWQQTLYQHLLIQLRKVQETSTHTKPIKPVCKIRSVYKMRDDIELIEVMSINLFSDLENKNAKFYMDRANTNACALVTFGKVTWRIAPRQCVPSNVPFYGYHQVHVDEAKRVWNRGVEVKYILRNILIEEISELKSIVRVDAPLQRLKQMDGTSILGFNIPCRAIEDVKNHYSEY